jgi:hypothetical protein
MLRDIFFDLSEYDARMFWRHVGKNDPRFTSSYEIPPGVNDRMRAFDG